MRFDIFTLFPGMFAGPFSESIVKRAIDAGQVEIHLHNIRDYTTDKHHITDDYAYGGGGGMVMKPEPIFAAVEKELGVRSEELGAQSAERRTENAERAAGGEESIHYPLSGINSEPTPNPQPPTPIILMSPAGRRFSTAIARELAAHPRIALICGHYEGVDERVREHLCTDAISIGDYVLTGGELPAMVVVDAVSRWIPGVLPEFAPRNESFSEEHGGLIEHPHYTRPAEFRGWRVPDVLLNGNHAEIEKWRRGMRR